MDVFEAISVARGMGQKALLLHRLVVRATPLEGKYIVKKAIEGLVPHEIIYRKKMGFPTPLRQWLMDPHARHILDLLRAKDGLLAA